MLKLGMLFRSVFVVIVVAVMDIGSVLVLANALIIPKEVFTSFVSGQRIFQASKMFLIARNIPERELNFENAFCKQNKPR